MQSLHWEYVLLTLTFNRSMKCGIVLLFCYYIFFLIQEPTLSMRFQIMICVFTLLIFQQLFSFIVQSTTLSSDVFLSKITALCAYCHAFWVKVAAVMPYLRLFVDIW